MHTFKVTLAALVALAALGATAEAKKNSSADNAENIKVSTGGYDKPPTSGDVTGTLQNSDAAPAPKVPCKLANGQACK